MRTDIPKLSIFLSGIYLLIATRGTAQNIGINVNGAAPHASALLDIDAGALPAGGKRGVLIPRMSDGEMNMIVAPATSLLVFNTSANGFYWYDGAAWVPLGGSGAGWALLGNGGTDENVNFLGTADNHPLVVRTNNVSRVRITMKGQIETLNTGESVFIGEGAGTNDDLSANQNVFLGHEAGAANVDGFNNSSVGFRALGQNTSGYGNTALGHATLLNNSSGILNTAMGSGALANSTTGNWNTAIGATAMAWNTIGAENTAVGAESLQQNTTGIHNTAVGYEAMANNTDGGHNTAVGFTSLYNNTSGVNNVAIGNSALRSNTVGFQSVALGSAALLSNTTGFENVAVGYWALRDNTTGWWNTAVGSLASFSLTTGEGNTAVGSLALNNNATGNGNSAFGFQALGTSSTGAYNTAIGRVALAQNWSGWNNVGVGLGADCTNQSGSNNTIIGTNAGWGTVAHSKSGCVFLGYSAGYSELGSDRLYIENSASASPLIYGEFDTDMVRINHNLGIGSSWFGGGTKVLSFEPGAQPASDIGHAMIFSQLQGGIAELLTMDGAGNMQPISPHHFSLSPRSEPMAWSFYSENAVLDRKVNVDMMRTVRLVEELCGERLVYMSDLEGNEVEELQRENDSLVERVERLERALARAQAEIDGLKDRCATNR